MESFAEWLDREYRYAATAMLASVSPVGIVKSRPGFGQSVRASYGAIVASPILAAYDPDPDYFFHWYRDSAVVIDALRLLFEAGSVGPEALAHVTDFVRFSRSLRALDGRTLVASPSWRAKVTADFTQYVRTDADLASAYGDAIAAESRVNPDGTLDISNWCRPQHDGPPLRALALLRWLHSMSVGAGVGGASPANATSQMHVVEQGHGGPALWAQASVETSELIRSDLAFTCRHWREPSFDIWEEERGQHYYILCIAAAALEEGAAWLEARVHGDLEAQSYRAEAEAIRRTLGEFWLPDAGHYRSRVLTSGARSTKELDIAVILAAIHAAGDGNAHFVQDVRMHATLAQLEALFDAAYPINHNRPAERGPAMGRYAGDAYYSGGAYYFSTLGAAEFCFRAAAGGEDANAWVRRGDAFLATVRAFTPLSGELSEQFDQRTGAQTSAKHLAWSYAAFISCVTARRAVTGN